MYTDQALKEQIVSLGTQVLLDELTIRIVKFRNTFEPTERGRCAAGIHGVYFELAQRFHEGMPGASIPQTNIHFVEQVVAKYWGMRPIAPIMIVQSAVA